ncbi:hypothetical protein HispidOSU_027004 [Sigmodon hispidus]
MSPEGKSGSGKGGKGGAASGSGSADKKAQGLKVAAMRQGSDTFYVKNMAKSWKPWKS